LVNYSSRSHGDKPSLYELQFGEPDSKKLVPFGRDCFYIDSTERPDTRKWDAPGRLGIIVGYSQHQSYQILDAEDLQSDKFRIIQSRDVVFPAEAAYPMLKMEFSNPFNVENEDFFMDSEDEEEVEQPIAEFEEEVRESPARTPFMDFLDGSRKAAGLVAKMLLGLAILGIAMPIHPSNPLSRSPQAIEAERREMNNVDKWKVWQWESVREWHDVSSSDAEAQVVELMMAHAIKNYEEDEASRLHKARLVARGCDVRDVWGSRVSEEELWGSTLSLSTLRAAMLTAAMHPEGTAESADAEAFYLQAPLKGTAKWGRLPKRLWPQHWHGKYKDPVIRIDKAIYGLERSQHDSGSYLHTRLLQDGWMALADYESWGCVYRRGEVVLVVYVDDFLGIGPKSALPACWESVKNIVVLKDEPQKIEKMLGIKMSIENVRSSVNVRRVVFSQSAYCKHIVDKLMWERGGRPLKNYTTPAEKLEDLPDDDQPGNYAGSAATHVGGALYLMRGTRPDIAQATCSLGSKVSKWTRRCDRELERLFGYLNSSSNFCLVYIVDTRDWLNVKLPTFCDSDHAGDVETRKSRCGVNLFVQGSFGTWALIDWCSRLVAMPSLSSGEAEVVATSVVLGAREGVKGMLLPISGVMEFLMPMQDNISMELHIDASVARGAIRTGYSKQMRYITKTHGVSIAWLHAVVQKLDIKVVPVASEDNSSDVHTKPLTRAVFEKFRDAMGVKAH